MIGEQGHFTRRYKSHHDAARELKKHFTADTDKREYVEELLAKEAMPPRVLYLHVPFCNKICSFCPFHKPDALRRSTYDGYLISKLEALSRFEYMKAPIGAVNFGGGTPTALSPNQMDRILSRIHSLFHIAAGSEISVETSVSELTDHMLEVFRKNGVNRLSIGVQTFDDPTRKLLNRRGTGQKAAERIRAAQKAGIDNVGIDLIYNYPHQTEKQLLDDLSMIKELGVAGISFYSLMLHEGTPLSSRLTSDEKRLMEDLNREYVFFSTILEELKPWGFEMFELTKLIRDNRDRYDYMRIRHNRGSCVGVGHGAGGNLDCYLYHNSHDVPDIGPHIPVSTRGRVVSEEYFVIDRFIHDLQKTRVHLKDYSRLLKMDLEVLLAPLTEQLEASDYIRWQEDGFELTQWGAFWGNNIISELVQAIIKARIRNA